MSLTKRRPVPGSSTITIIRAATPSRSGIVANSRPPTVIAPSVTGIGFGKGSMVLCARTSGENSSIAAANASSRLSVIAPSADISLHPFHALLLDDAVVGRRHQEGQELLRRRGVRCVRTGA